MKKLKIDGDIDYYQTPQEVYSLDRVAPVWWQTGSIVPHAFYRKAICEGSAGLPVELRYFANSPFKAVVPAGIGNDRYPLTYQPKFCAFLNEVPTQVIRQNLNGFTTINQKMYDWLSDTELHLDIGLVNEGTETFDFPSPHANHIYAQHGAACPNAVTPFTNGTNYKKLFISEDQFICVAMDCSNIDCSNYQDCVP
jgi:hypothetical protein